MSVNATSNLYFDDYYPVRSSVRSFSQGFQGSMGTGSSADAYVVHDYPFPLQNNQAVTSTNTLWACYLDLTFMSPSTNSTVYATNVQIGVDGSGGSNSLQGTVTVPTGTNTCWSFSESSDNAAAQVSPAYTVVTPPTTGSGIYCPFHAKFRLKFTSPLPELLLVTVSGATNQLISFTGTIHCFPLQDPNPTA